MEIFRIPKAHCHERHIEKISKNMSTSRKQPNSSININYGLINFHPLNPVIALPQQKWWRLLFWSMHFKLHSFAARDRWVDKTSDCRLCRCALNALFLASFKRRTPDTLRGTTRTLKTKIVPENRESKKGNDRIPTIHFQVRTVSFREGDISHLGKIRRTSTQKCRLVGDMWSFPGGLKNDKKDPIPR